MSSESYSSSFHLLSYFSQNEISPKVSKNVSLDVFDSLGPFWAHVDTFVPFQTKINLLPQKDKVGFGGGAFEQKNHCCIYFSVK